MLTEANATKTMFKFSISGTKNSIDSRTRITIDNATAKAINSLHIQLLRRVSSS